MRRRIIPTPLPRWDSWEDIMELALVEASLAAQKGEVPVGAVIIDKQGTLLAAGHNICITTNDPTAHAEIVVLRKAAAETNNYRLNGCYLAVTLEPCLMCVGAIVHARLSGVVYGASDPKSGAVSSCFDGFDVPFHNHSVWHMGKILEPQSLALLHNFFTQKR